jgi:uncharacterized membrane protein YfcA
MANFLLLAIVGLIAQLVDGSLGMAYGVTSQSLLLTVGIAPALASASVHIAEVGTTAASGASHWRFGNVDWAKVWPLAIPGAIGAFFGAVVLSAFITAEAAEPIVAIFLFGLGVFVLARFSFRRHERPVQVRPVARGFLAPLGLIAGFLDAAGGGGWGPISTPTLLSSGRMEPRKIIGTVDTSEFLVALSASIGFLLALTFAQVPWTVVGALLLGGVIAAYIVRILPARILGTAVGGVILITNMKTFLGAVGISGPLAILIYVAIVAIWIAALTFSIRVNRQEKGSGVAGEASASRVV